MLPLRAERSRSVLLELWAKDGGSRQAREADKTRRTFRLVGGIVGGIAGVWMAIGLYALGRDLLDVKPDAFGITHRHPTLMQRLTVFFLPLGFGFALWFIGYQVADKCFEGIRWVVRKTSPYG